MVKRRRGAGAAVRVRESIQEQYALYLDHERGLSARTVTIYGSLVRGFLASLGSEHWTAHSVREYLLDRAQGSSPSYVHLLASSLRSFLKFLFLRGKTRIDLSLAVPKVWMRPTSLPSFLSPEEVERVLATADRSTPTGRRDRAVLLLLARLGLRAGDVAALELGDVRWSAGEIVIRGKGRSTNRLPLPSEVGAAIALYVRRDRVRTESRRVFLRQLPPQIGFAGPAAIGHIVRRALCRAGLRLPTRRGAAHLFRHGLATLMVRRGASLPEIAEILGHRDLNTTSGYSRVALEALREVARPWPTKRGAR